MDKPIEIIEITRISSIFIEKLRAFDPVYTEM